MKNKRHPKISNTIKLTKQTIHFTYYNLLIAQDLWQVHYQILSIFFLKGFIKLIVNMGTMKKNVKLAELN